MNLVQILHNGLYMYIAQQYSSKCLDSWLLKAGDEFGVGETIGRNSGQLPRL